ncbi:MAG: rhombosortase [Idiomarina sp.]|nr:rhombosortase [Idiomarina sp.]
MPKFLNFLAREWQFLAFAAGLLFIWVLQPMWLAFERPLIDAGQWWRLFTGQYLHLSLGHLLGNLGGLGIAWLLFADHWRGWRFAVVAAVCVLGSNLGMWLLHPYIEYYVGFSGALYGLIAFGALNDWLQGIRFGMAISIALVLKVSYEYFIAPLPFWGSSADSLLAVEAHFFGALSGLLMVLLLIGWRRACRSGGA